MVKKHESFYIPVLKTLESLLQVDGILAQVNRHACRQKKNGGAWEGGGGSGRDFFPFFITGDLISLNLVST